MEWIKSDVGSLVLEHESRIYAVLMCIPLVIRDSNFKEEILFKVTWQLTIFGSDRDHKAIFADKESAVRFAEEEVNFSVEYRRKSLIFDLPHLTKKRSM